MRWRVNWVTHYIRRGDEMNKVKELLEVRTQPDNSELIVLASNQIKEAVRAIFETNQFVNVIGVHGHTPHFNDGDECKWGIEVQVDWLGDSFYSPLSSDPNRRDEAYTKLLSEPPASWGGRRNEDPNYNALNDSRNLLYTYSNEFDIWDDGNNGTWWIFVRDPGTNNFVIHFGHYEHD